MAKETYLKIVLKDVSFVFLKTQHIKIPLHYPILDGKPLKNVLIYPQTTETWSKKLDVK